MKTILLMRHAKAAKGLPGQDDFDRPLTEVGRENALQTGRVITKAGLQIDRIISSSAIRTSETAALVASTASASCPVVLLPDLYNAPTDAVEDAIRRQATFKSCCLLVVGHNPGIAELMSRWSGQDLSVPPGTTMVLRPLADDWCTSGTGLQPCMAVTGIIQGGEFVWKEISADVARTSGG